jgi:hypothetical protein
MPSNEFKLIDTYDDDLLFIPKRVSFGSLVHHITIVGQDKMFDAGTPVGGLKVQTSELHVIRIQTHLLEETHRQAKDII